MKILEKIFCTLGLRKDFLDMTQDAWSIKENIGKLDFIKIKISAFWKMPGEWKRHATGWEKIAYIFANHVFDKQLISRTYKELWVC